MFAGLPIESTTLQVEYLIFFELTHRCPVGAFNVISDNFQLWFGIYPRLGREEEVAVELAGVGKLRRLGNANPPVKYPVGAAVDNIFVELVCRTVGAAEGDRTVGVGDLVAGNQR